MASFNDLHYGFGVSCLAISGTGGTLLVPEIKGVIRRWVYADGGTVFITGYSQALGTTHVFPLTSTTVPITIDGPAAFVLIATTNGGSAKVFNFYTSPGIPDTNQAT